MKITIGELKSLTYIKRQIVYYEAQLNQYDKKMKYEEKTSSTGISNPTGMLALHNVETQEMLNQYLEKYKQQFEKIQKFIDEIEELHLKLLVKALYVENKSMIEFSSEVDKTSRTVQRWHKEFKKKYIKI